MPAHSSFSRHLRVVRDEMLPSGCWPIGYSALVGALALEVPMPLQPHCGIDRHVRRNSEDGWSLVTPRAFPDDTFAGHLTFALKNEALDLAILKRSFLTVGPRPVEAMVRAAPSGVYARKAWFLYEWLTGERLNLPDAAMGNYADLMAPEDYVTAAPLISRRHRIRDNLPGTRDWCPVIRRTPALERNSAASLGAMIGQLMQSSSPTLLSRAARSLVFGETRTSYEIEGERPPRDKLERWASAILSAGREPLSAPRIEHLQRTALAEGAVDTWGWRTRANFVGGFDREYNAAPERVNAAPGDVPGLMDGLFRGLARMAEGDAVDPVVAAAAASFGFVYIHPLEDGNGRTSRYLVHDVLAARGFSPKGMVFPVSMQMLARIDEYGAVLHGFDERVMPATRWRHAPNGGVELLNDTGDFYRYPDLTREAEFVADCVRATVERDFPHEIERISRLDRCLEGLSRVVDMPNARMLDFIMFVQQNTTAPGKLPYKRAKSDFKQLKPEEIRAMEQVIARTMGEVMAVNKRPEVGFSQPQDAIGVWRPSIAQAERVHADDEAEDSPPAPM